jgi:hypothetical protein
LSNPHRIRKVREMVQRGRRDSAACVAGTTAKHRQ